MSKILLVEDDANFGAVLRDFLQINKYQVTWADNGAKGLSIVQLQTFDICILDVMMPHVDGFTLAAEIKKLHPNLPFIFLTAKGLKEDVIAGFKLGAVDYITKPFDSEVLLYRIEASLRKAPEKPKVNQPVAIGSYQFNLNYRSISFNGKDEKLSPKEADLLALLYQYKNQVLDRDLALSSIWGDGNYFTARSMDVYITKLRKYLRDDPRIRIENIHGRGFQLCIEE